MVKLLIGYDGSECAADAIDDLRRAGLPPDRVEALVLSVADILPVSPGPEYEKLYPQEAQRVRRQAAEALAEAQAQADEAAQRVARLFPQWQVRAEAAGDSPYWALVMKAQQWPADLLVVGSHGRSAMGRFIFGSVSQNAVLYADCSARVARCRSESQRAGDGAIRLIVGWDGSPDAATAVRAVARRTWPRDTECRLVTAIDPRLMTLLAGGEAPEGSGHDGEDLLRRARAAADELRNAGLRIGEPIMRDGDPKQLLLDEASACSADCIFVGAKGMSRVQRVLLGSVSAAVAARADCSVEVVRSRHPQ